MFFKCQGSRHNHKEIQIQMDMKRIDMILCKRDQNLIGRLKFNTFNGVHFEAFFKFAYVPLWYNFNKSMF